MGRSVGRADPARPQRWSYPPAACTRVYEALTVAINQLVHRDRTGFAGQQFYFDRTRALIGREQHIAD